ncbi:heparan-alpha-glucosaminide N-acetyltransferase domain-containing protein [Microbacterium sp. gxy059]|uniref:heparan-alpha-glucosaminide N-acetyltransferase domain-containing protein n=1 Tax=Microbacterium sp. gxy059 TaxID=2957199 RepID=UPI003D97D790
MAAASAGGVGPARLLRRARLDGPGREPGVDLARGLAVFGMFAAHVLPPGEPLRWGDPSTWPSIVHGSSSILFATLAGVSLALLSGGPRPATGPRLAVLRGRVLVRAGALLVIGVLLTALPTPVYVILPAYGILFALALPLLSLRAGALAATAAALAVATPFAYAALDRTAAGEALASPPLADLVGWHYPFLVWISFLAAGLAVGRSGLGSPLVAAGLVLAGLGLAAVGSAIGSSSAPALSAEPHGSGLGETIGSGGLAIAVIGACVLVCRTPLRHLLWPVRAVGSLALTAYVGQLVAWSIWIAAASAGGRDVDPLGGFWAVEPFWPMTIGTLVLCTLWALLVGRGPLEALLGSVARGIVPGSASAPGAGGGEAAR